MSDEYLPYGTRVHAKMLHELAVKLRKDGHNVFVITPGTNNQPKRLKIDILDQIVTRKEQVIHEKIHKLSTSY